MSALLSSVEIAMRDGLVTDPHIIPPITDPLGRHWTQPDRRDITIDDTHAMMSEADLAKLADYTHSEPTGVYPGKMWKALYSSSRLTCPACGAKKELHLVTRWYPNRLWLECYCHHCKCHWSQKPVWWLKWFGPSFIHPKDGRCVSNNAREIIVL